MSWTNADRAYAKTREADGEGPAVILAELRAQGCKVPQGTLIGYLYRERGSRPRDGRRVVRQSPRPHGAIEPQRPPQKPAQGRKPAAPAVASDREETQRGADRSFPTQIQPVAASLPWLLPPPARDGGQLLSVLDLTNETCRWPLGEVERATVAAIFCGKSGADLTKGRPYCPECAGRARGIIPPPRPRPSYIPPRNQTL